MALTPQVRICIFPTRNLGPVRSKQLINASPSGETKKKRDQGSSWNAFFSVFYPTCPRPFLCFYYRSTGPTRPKKKKTQTKPFWVPSGLPDRKQPRMGLHPSTFPHTGRCSPGAKRTRVCARASLHHTFCLYNPSGDHNSYFPLFTFPRRLTPFVALPFFLGLENACLLASHSARSPARTHMICPHPPFLWLGRYVTSHPQRHQATVHTGPTFFIESTLTGEIKENRTRFVVHNEEQIEGAGAAVILQSPGKEGYMYPRRHYTNGG